jgi:hypothetical protein
MPALLDDDQFAALDGGRHLFGEEERRGRVVAAAHHDGRAFDPRQVGPAVGADRRQLLLALIDLHADLAAHRRHRVDQLLVGQPVGRDEARHLHAQHQLEMAFVGEPDAGAADGALGFVLAAHAGIEQRQLRHTFCSELHDLDRQHAAQRQAGEGEFSGRHLIDDPARRTLPAVPDRQRRTAPVGHHDLGLARECRDLVGIQSR